MGSQPSAPTLDTAQSKALTQADYDLKRENTPGLVEATGKAGREEYARNIAFGLQAFADPSSIFQFDLQDAGKQISETNKKIADMGGWRTDRSGRRYNPTSKKWVSEADYQKQLTGLNKTLERQRGERKDLEKMARDPVGTLERTFKDEFKLRDQFQGQLDDAQTSSSEYTRMQRALQKGLNAQTVGQRSARAAQAKAATAGIVEGPQAQRMQASTAGIVRGPQAQRMQASTAGIVEGPQAQRMQASTAGIVEGPQAQRMQAARAAFVKGPQAAMARGVDDISAGRVRSGALGQSLMARALAAAQSGGRLNAEAERDAIQSARQSMAARGMATGAAGAAAELLNRDSYRRAREMEDLAFASGVQGQDLERQFQNVGNTLAADQANQAMAAQLAMADQDATNQMRLSGYQGTIQQRQAEADREQAASAANQAAINQMRALGYEGLIGQRQFNASQQQAASAANQAAMNQMRALGYEGLIDQRQFNASQQQAASAANQAAINQMGALGYEGLIGQRQFDASQQQAASVANQTAINQMRALGYEGLIDQRQFNASQQQGVNLANMQALNNMRQFNTGLAADTDRFNAGQRTDAQRFNVGMLQSSALAADNERARQLGLGQSAYNFALQTNPKLMLAGLGSPYANFTPQALGLMNNTNVQPIYSGGSAGTYGSNMMLAGTLGGGALAAGGVIGAAII